MNFFIPVALKNPLFSHKLSLLGFWSLALLYPFLGTHHYIFCHIPYMTQTVSIVCSMLLIVLVWVVFFFFWGLVFGCWLVFLGFLVVVVFVVLFFLFVVFFFFSG